MGIFSKKPWVIIKLKNYNTICGQLLTPTFRLKTVHGEFEFKANNVRFICFFEDNTVSFDMRGGSELEGVFQNPVIQIKMSDGTKITIQKNEIDFITISE